MQSRLEDDEASDVDGANYQLEMMRCLREVNVDNNTVGWCAEALQNMTYCPPLLAFATFGSH